MWFFEVDFELKLRILCPSLLYGIFCCKLQIQQQIWGSKNPLWCLFVCVCVCVCLCICADLKQSVTHSRMFHECFFEKKVEALLCDLIIVNSYELNEQKYKHIDVCLVSVLLLCLPQVWAAIPPWKQGIFIFPSGAFSKVQGSLILICLRDYSCWQLAYWQARAWTDIKTLKWHRSFNFLSLSLINWLIFMRQKGRRLKVRRGAESATSYLQRAQWTPYHIYK